MTEYDDITYVATAVNTGLIIGKQMGVLDIYFIWKCFIH